MTTESEPDLATWERQYALRLVESVNTLRLRYGWSIPKLVEKLGEVGWTVTKDTLNGILSTKKRRSFTVGEVLCFARVFEVPPEFLLLGLPSMADLPRSLVLENPTVIETFRWYRGHSESVFVASHLDPLVHFSHWLRELERENAIWYITGKPRTTTERPYGDEVRVVDQLLRRLRRHLGYWSANLEAGRLAPDLPQLPQELADLLQEGAPGPDEPIEVLLTDSMLDATERDMRRSEEAQADVDRMKEARDGSPSDTPQ